MGPNLYRMEGSSILKLGEVSYHEVIEAEPPNRRNTSVCACTDTVWVEDAVLGSLADSG